MPATKALLKRSYDTSLPRLTSSSQTISGSSANISKPLTRCRIDTHPAGGSLYSMASINRMFSPGRGLVCSAIAVLGSRLGSIGDFISTAGAGRCTRDKRRTGGTPSVQFVAIVVRIGAVQAAPQFHRALAVGERAALHAEQRRAGRHRQPFSRRRRGGNGTDLLFGAQHLHAERGLEQRVHRSLVLSQALRGQVLEQATR